MKASICLLVVLGSASSFADNATNQLPTIAEIDAEIAGLANQYGARTLWREFEATAGRIRNLQDSFPTQEVLQVQWHVVSNMFSGCYTSVAVTNSNQVNYQGLEAIIRHHLTKYKLFHVDTNTLMYVAVVQARIRGEYMPEIGSTNALTGQPAPHDFNTYTNRVRLYVDWRSVLSAKSGFNQNLRRFRREVFNYFCALILHDLSEYPEPTRRSFWEEFCRRAGASDKEKAEAHSDLYRWYKIVYP